MNIALSVCFYEYVYRSFNVCNKSGELQTSNETRWNAYCVSINITSGKTNLTHVQKYARWPESNEKTRKKSFSITTAAAVAAALATATAKNASFVIACVGEGHVIHIYAILYITWTIYFIESTQHFSCIILSTHWKISERNW